MNGRFRRPSEALRMSALSAGAAQWSHQMLSHLVKQGYDDCDDQAVRPYASSRNRALHGQVGDAHPPCFDEDRTPETLTLYCVCGLGREVRHRASIPFTGVRISWAAPGPPSPNWIGQAISSRSGAGSNPAGGSP